MDKISIAEVEKEYKKIDEKWLNLHFKTSISLVLFTIFVECVMGIFLYKMGEIHLGIPRYLIKYLFAPFALNSFFILVDYLVLYQLKVSQNVKIYMVSFLFVMICFTLFTVHIIFPTLYFIFSIAILLTIVYGNYLLTIIIAGVSLASMSISELFITWDSEKLNILKDGQRMTDFILSIFILLAFSAVSMVVIRFEKEKNEAAIQKELERCHLKKKIQLDELTGIKNRTALRIAMNEMELDYSDNSYILAMIDLDNFKRLNDSFGHVMGDQYLVEFANILKTTCKGATPFRYGGDEFCILFQNSTLDYVVKVCQSIQKAIEVVDMGIDMEFSFTVSIGIAQYLKHTNSTKLFINTDKALYESKTIKNTIRIFEELE